MTCAATRLSLAHRYLRLSRSFIVAIFAGVRHSMYVCTRRHLGASAPQQLGRYEDVRVTLGRDPLLLHSSLGTAALGLISTQRRAPARLWPRFRARVQPIPSSRLGRSTGRTGACPLRHDSGPSWPPFCAQERSLLRFAAHFNQQADYSAATSFSISRMAAAWRRADRSSRTPSRRSGAVILSPASPAALVRCRQCSHTTSSCVQSPSSFKI